MPNKKDLLLEKRRYNLPQEITSDEQKLLDQNWPIQKIIGYVDLANVRIDVSNNILIPRYETEELIYYALEQIKQNSNITKVLDLCSGSGFIGLALKKNNPNLTITCADISQEAVASSHKNSLLNKLNIKIVQSDLFENIDDKYDLIISNPPYISHKEKLDNSVLDFEPHIALFAPDDGLYFYKRILSEGWNYLSENGFMMFEINPFHLSFWHNLRNQWDITIIKDISSKNRFVIVKKLKK